MKTKVKYLEDGEKGTIKFSCDKKYNILTPDAVDQFEKIMLKILKKRNPRVVVIEGDKDSYITGFDINGFKDLPASTVKKILQRIVILLDKIEESSKIFISAVSGYCLGGGLELAMATDYIIASKKSKFGLPEIKLGIPPGADGIKRLVNITGKRKTMELILSGRIIDAKEAKEIGLVNEIVQNSKISQRAHEFADQLIKANRPAVEAIKTLCARAEKKNISKEEIESCAQCLKTNHSKESIRAFLNKNKK